MKIFYLLLISLLSIPSFGQSYFQKPAEASPIANRSVITPIVATIPYQGYDETQAYLGEGEYEIFLDNVDGILSDPIIVLDGFDPGNTRSITDLYNSLSYNGDNMADILRNEGFDIVILNAPQYTTNGKDIDGGSDYIQRNAMVLVELINTLNAQKVGAEGLVVLGPSMGGLIAQYALSYMEANSMDAETRLFISFDAPHRGANIPVSLQYMINYLADQSGDPDAQAIVDNVINSPAAKEMLYDHYTAHLLAGSTYEQDPTLLLPMGATGFRDVFQNELDALGFPSLVRNVAMVNGSGSAATTGTPDIQVVDTTLDIGGGITTDVTLHFTPAASQINNITFIENFFVGVPVSLFSADAQAFAYTDGIDSSPGGISSISTALGDGGGNPVILAFIAALEQDDYSFIPTISSLAISNEDDWYAVPDIGGTHTSPFVNTYIQDDNQPHVTITEDNAQFALDEIRDNQLSIGENVMPLAYALERNPVGSEIALRLHSSYIYSQITLRLYSMTGQLLLQETIVQPGERIVLPHALKTGMYLLHIEDTERTQTLPFIVNR